MKRAAEELMRQRSVFDAVLTKREEYEFANLLTCAMLATEAAMMREESRGGHFREDFPRMDDQQWRSHIVFQRDAGVLEEEIGDV